MERREFRRGFQSYAPVKVGDELDVEIESVGEKGDGVAKKDGFVLFVPGTKKGDNVKVKVTRVLRKVGFAEVIGSEAQQEAQEEEAQEQQEESGEEEQSEESGEESSEETDTSEDTEDFGEEEDKD